MRWLITGGCGFIGAGLARQLVSEPRNAVRVLDNLSVGKLENLGDIESATRLPGASMPKWCTDRVDVCIGDICDATAFHEAAAGADVIVHLAANSGVLQSVDDPIADCQTNVLGTLNGLEAARRHGIGRFVFASSGAVLGDAEPPFGEGQLPRPGSPYGASKLSGEAYCRAYLSVFGLETVSLRFSNVYGPGSGHKGSVVATFVKQALAGLPLTIEGDGTQSRDFLFLGDLLEAIRLASVKEGIAGEVFHVASGTETRILDLGATIMEALSGAGVRNISATHVQPRPGDIARNFASIEKVQRALGWKPRMPLIDGIRATVDWFLQARGAKSG